MSRIRLSLLRTRWNNCNCTAWQAPVPSAPQMAGLWTLSVLTTWSLRRGIPEAATAPKRADSEPCRTPGTPQRAVARTTGELCLGLAPHSNCRTLTGFSHQKPVCSSLKWVPEEGILLGFLQLSEELLTIFLLDMQGMHVLKTASV